jgi:hypothetical protein
MSLWPGAWVPALLLLFACVFGWEFFWRGQGFRPSMSDDPGLFSLSRREATRQGSDAFVLVGSSRMQMGIHREALARTTGWAPAVQLAVVRGPSRPVLRHLADDPAFRGNVLCEINPSLFFSHTPGYEREIENYLDVFDQFSLADRTEQHLAMLVQANLVTRLSRLQPRVIRNAIRFRQMPTPRYEGVVRADRFRYANYQHVRNVNALHARIRRDLAGPDPNVLDAAAFDARIRATNQMAETIRSRGGNVIFIRLPSSLMVLEREQRLWPREQWWDVFADRTQFATIHYADDPALASFVPPDGDHLGGLQAERFARALGEDLVARGLAPGMRGIAR